MSDGKPEDRANTVSCVKKQRPATTNGVTWLRHREHAQSGVIDLMILEGIHCIEDIAKKIPSRRDFQAKIRRIESHISHLEDKPAEKNKGMGPHKLKVSRRGGILKFDV